jgi:hypothetical protein
MLRAVKRYHVKTSASPSVLNERSLTFEESGGRYCAKRLRPLPNTAITNFSTDKLKMCSDYCRCFALVDPKALNQEARTTDIAHRRNLEEAVRKIIVEVSRMDQSRGEPRPRRAGAVRRFQRDTALIQLGRIA